MRTRKSPTLRGNLLPIAAATCGLAALANPAQAINFVYL